MNWDLECDVSRSWLEDNLRDLRKGQETVEEQTAHSDLLTMTVSSRYHDLYVAAVSGDIETARKVCQKLKLDNQLHAGVIKTTQRLEEDWLSDRLGIHEIASAFWTLRRILDQNQTRKPKGVQASLGKGLIIVRQGEEHSFGAQLLADRLESSHWEVDLILDANNDTILQQVEQSSWNALGISVGCDQNLLGLADLISEIRLRSCDKDVKVLVGGSVFQDPLKQYDFLHADAVCNDSETAMQLFNQLGGYNA